MTNPRSGRAAISGQEQEPKRLKQPAGKDDATGWTHGGTDTLRDSEGGTYGTLPGEERPEQGRGPAADAPRAGGGPWAGPPAAGRGSPARARAGPDNTPCRIDRAQGIRQQDER